MNPRLCLSAHPPNPPFQPTRADVWRVQSGSFCAGGWTGALGVSAGVSFLSSMALLSAFRRRIMSMKSIN